MVRRFRASVSLLLLLIAVANPCSSDVLTRGVARSLQSTRPTTSPSVSRSAASTSGAHKGSSAGSSRHQRHSKTQSSGKAEAGSSRAPSSRHAKSDAGVDARAQAGCMAAELTGGKARVALNVDAPALTRGVLTIVTKPVGPSYTTGRTTYNLFLKGLPSWLTGNLGFQIYNKPPYMFKNVGLTNGLWKRANATDSFTASATATEQTRNDFVADAGKPVYAVLMAGRKAGQYLAAGVFNFTVPCPSNLTAVWP